MSTDARERLKRVLRALPLIIQRESVPIAEMEVAAGVDALTLLDDLRVLTERDDEPGGFVEAVSILFDADSVSVRSPHFARPMRITLPELCALELGLAIVGASSVGAERDTVEGARTRVRAAIVAMPESAAREDLWYASGPVLSNEGLLGTLKTSAAEKVKVRIVYRKGGSEESTERVVHPYTVLPVRGAWFLIAHCERSEGVRFFRVDRVLSAASLTETFERRPDVDLDALLSAERALVSESAERLVVRYGSRIVRWIAEREEGEAGRDGSFTVSHPLADDDWAVRHVLQYGPEAEVVEPARVRVLVAHTLRQMMKEVAQ